MRYTPFLDARGIKLKEEIDSDWAANVIDGCLQAVEASIDWGEYQGKKRKPCREQPLLLSGAPIGMYHCPGCDMMLLASMPHFEPTSVNEETPYQSAGIEHYEDEYGKPWPPGYEE